MVDGRTKSSNQFNFEIFSWKLRIFIGHNLHPTKFMNLFLVSQLKKCFMEKTKIMKIVSFDCKSHSQNWPLNLILWQILLIILDFNLLLGKICWANAIIIKNLFLLLPKHTCVANANMCVSTKGSRAKCMEKRCNNKWEHGDGGGDRLVKLLHYYHFVFYVHL